MHQHDRHQLIIERARTLPRVEVATLADLMKVTPETVRRDLTVLERHGLLRRVHGGAVAVERLGFEPAVDDRTDRRPQEKARIAAAALAYVPDEGSILIDAGTTTLRLVELLPVGRELTVVTNSIPVATAVARRADLSLYVIGGRVRQRTLAAVGSWGVAALRNIHVDVAFLGTNGISMNRGLTTPDQAEADSKRAMVDCAARTIVMADSSKVGSTHFSRFAQLEEIDVLITDTDLDAETAAEIEGHGPQVVRA